MPDTWESAGARVYRFGVFELDVRSRELRKHGVRIKLQEQPTEILFLLLEHVGDVVTREQIQKHLWSGNTFVDFDNAINSAVRKLREALGDTAENPRFVETLARRGYRFVAPIEVGSDAAEHKSDRPRPLLQVSADTAAGLAVRRVRRMDVLGVWWLVGVAAILATVVVIVQQFTRSSAAPRIVRHLQITNDGRAKSYLNNARPIIVTDGSRVYFAETATGPMRSALHQVSQSGGETSALPADLQENVEIGDISPDGSNLLLQTYASPEPEMRLWTLRVTGGAPSRLGDLRGRDATWSADGRKIAYAKSNELYVCDADASGNKRLVSGRGPIRWPRWAPDGSVLRYSRGEPAANIIIEEVSVNGGPPRPVLPGWKGPHCCGNWTADGKYYVFQSATGTGQTTDLWVIRERHGLFQRANMTTRLTAGPIDFQSAVPGKDGTRLFAIGTHPRGGLVRYDSVARQFVPYLGGISAYSVETSRDGKWCAYVSYPDGLLWRSKVDGTERLQLTPAAMEVALPRWSPDGKRIAFMGRTEGEPVAIYVASPEGGKLERILVESLNQGDPSWSPDGASLAFGRLSWLEASSLGGIQIANMGTRQITTLPGSERLYSPHWSPDGRYMLASHLDGPGMRLFDFNRRTWQQITDLPVAYPNWSRDGQYVHFINPYVAVPALYRVHVADGGIERIVNIDRQQFGWTMVGKWTGLAADDSPLVLRDIGIQEIFSLSLQLP